MTLRLVTIPFSHYCEKARWALDRAGLDYVEETHPPVLHFLGTVPRGGRSVPLLVTPGATLTDSTHILQWVDARTTDDKRLYPHDPALRREVEALEDRFDEEVGPHSRRWAYSFVLDDDRVVNELFAREVNVVRGRAIQLLRPVATRIMRRYMNVDRATGQRSLEIVRRVFDDVDARLADGRRFLVGDRFTAADLTFAALAAPVLDPPEYGKILDGIARAAGMVDEIETFRARPAGLHALRVYREERGARGGAG